MAFTVGDIVANVKANLDPFNKAIGEVEKTLVSFSKKKFEIDFGFTGAGANKITESVERIAESVERIEKRIKNFGAVFQSVFDKVGAQVLNFVDVTEQVSARVGIGFLKTTSILASLSSVTIILGQTFSGLAAKVAPGALQMSLFLLSSLSTLDAFALLVGSLTLAKTLFGLFVGSVKNLNNQLGRTFRPFSQFIDLTTFMNVNLLEARRGFIGLTVGATAAVAAMSGFIPILSTFQATFLIGIPALNLVLKSFLSILGRGISEVASVLGGTRSQLKLMFDDFKVFGTAARQNSRTAAASLRSVEKRAVGLSDELSRVSALARVRLPFGTQLQITFAELQKTALAFQISLNEVVGTVKVLTVVVADSLGRGEEARNLLKQVGVQAKQSANDSAKSITMFGNTITRQILSPLARVKDQFIAQFSPVVAFFNGIGPTIRGAGGALKTFVISFAGIRPALAAIGGISFKLRESLGRIFTGRRDSAGIEKQAKKQEEAFQKVKLTSQSASEQMTAAFAKIIVAIEKVVAAINKLQQSLGKFGNQAPAQIRTATETVERFGTTTRRAATMVEAFKQKSAQIGQGVKKAQPNFESFLQTLGTGFAGAITTIENLSRAEKAGLTSFGKGFQNRLETIQKFIDSPLKESFKDFLVRIKKNKDAATNFAGSLDKTLSSLNNMSTRILEGAKNAGISKDKMEEFRLTLSKLRDGSISAGKALLDMAKPELANRFQKAFEAFKGINFTGLFKKIREAGSKGAEVADRAGDAIMTAFGRFFPFSIPQKGPLRVIFMTFGRLLGAALTLQFQKAIPIAVGGALRLVAAIARPFLKLPGRIARSLVGLGRRITSVITAAFRGGGGGLLDNFIVQTAKAEFATIQLARRLGIAVEKFSALRFVAEAVGSDINELGFALKFMGRNIDEAIGDPAKLREFKRLGINIGKIRDATNPSIEGLLQLADAVKRFGQGSRDAEKAARAFGLTVGTRLTSLLALGRKGINEFIKEFAKANAAITKEGAATISKLIVRIALFRAQVLAFARDIAIGLSPIFTSITKKIGKFLKDNRAEIKAFAITAVQTLSGLFVFVTSDVKNLGRVFKAVFDFVSTIVLGAFSRLAKRLPALVSDLLDVALIALEGQFGKIATVVFGITINLLSLKFVLIVAFVKNLLFELGGVITDGLIQLVRLAIAGLIESIKKAAVLKKLPGVLGSIFKLIDKFIGKKAIKALEKFSATLEKRTINPLKRLKTLVSDTVTDTFKVLKEIRQVVKDVFKEAGIGTKLSRDNTQKLNNALLLMSKTLSLLGKDFEQLGLSAKKTLIDAFLKQGVDIEAILLKIGQQYRELVNRIVQENKRAADNAVDLAGKAIKRIRDITRSEFANLFKDSLEAAARAVPALTELQKLLKDHEIVLKDIAKVEEKRIELQMRLAKARKLLKDTFKFGDLTAETIFIATSKNIEARVKQLNDIAKTLAKGAEDIGKKIAAIVPKKKVVKVENKTAKAIAEQVSGAIFGGASAALDAILTKGKSITEALAQFGSQLLKKTLSKALDDLQEKLTTALTEALGKAKVGAAAGALVSGIVAAAALVLSRLEDTATATRKGLTSAIQETEKLRGVLAGRTEVGIAEVGENLATIFEPQRFLLEEIRDVLFDIRTNTGGPTQQSLAGLVGGVRP